MLKNTESWKHNLKKFLQQIIYQLGIFTLKPSLQFILNIKTCLQILGHKTDFIVDTCSAGAGTLAVTIDGPSKVSMDCTEVEEGYKVRYTPLVPGEYYISLKYNGYHIVGSPFKVICTGML